MRLIGLAVILTVGLILAPLAAEAQPPGKVPRIGVLVVPTCSFFSTRIEAFRQGLRESGYVEGKSVLIQYRYAEGKLDLLPALASELVARIGYLALGTATTSAGSRKAFIHGLRDHGWIEEKNIAIEYRWAGGGQPTLDPLAAELARLPLDVIFAVNTPASLAMKRTGTTLPVVFAQVSEPVAIGLVDSLARPGRNFTTTINRELMSKRLGS